MSPTPRTPLAAFVARATVVAAVAVTALVAAPARAQPHAGPPAPPPAKPETTGLYLAGALAGALHRDIEVLDWNERPDDYLHLDLGLRLGAAWNGGLLGLALEHGAMLGGPRASYVALFGGYGIHASPRTILELTTELGFHFFHDVGALVGNYDVVKESHAQLPFWGARLTAAFPRARWRWQPAAFIGLRADLGRETVTSDLRMSCPSFQLGFPDGPSCTDGASSAATSSIGGITLLAGFELRRIMNAFAGRGDAGHGDGD